MENVITYESCPNCKKWDLIAVIVDIPDITFHCGYCGLVWDDDEMEELKAWDSDMDPMWATYYDDSRYGYGQRDFWPGL